MIAVICSRCGGSGQIEYYDNYNYGHGGFYSEICPCCLGTGKVEELSFEERKQQNKEVQDD